MSYLFDRLTTNPEQRNGAYDLAEDLGGEPAALAQAGAVMAGIGHRLPQLPGLLRPAAGAAAAAAGGAPAPAAAVTWLLSADYAEEAAARRRHLAAARARRAAGQPRDSPRRAHQPGRLPVPRRHRRPVPGPAARAVGSRGPGTRRARPVGPARPCTWAGPLQRAARAAAPAELLERAVRAAADAVLEAWPKDQPRSVPGRADAGVRGQPAAPCRRCAVGRRQLPPGAAGRRAEPGRRPARRPGGRLVAGGGRPQRAAARPRPSATR